MADFLAANPRDVIVLGLSNINCGDVPTARTQLLGLLAQSPLYKYLATQVGWIGERQVVLTCICSSQECTLIELLHLCLCFWFAVLVPVVGVSSGSQPIPVCLMC